MKKKILSFITLLCMVTALFPANVIAVSAYTGTKYGDYLYYQVESNGEVTITDCDISATKAEIPAEIDGKPVTKIGRDAFFGCALTSVTIPNSVDLIDEMAFYECENLESITIPISVTSIGERAFQGCRSLTEITIPNSVTNIDSYAFHGTGYYEDDSNWENEVLYLGDILLTSDRSISGSYEVKTGTRLICAGAFSNCSNLTSITIPDSVTSVGSYAFYDTGYYNDNNNWENGVLYIDNILVKVKSVSGEYEIKAGTRLICVGAFEECTDLTGITIPNSVASICKDAFYKCTGLKNVYISDLAAYLNCRYDNDRSVPMLYASVLRLNSNLIKGDLKIPDNVTQIPSYAFSKCNLTNVTIANNVKSIGNYAFYNCENLASVAIPNSVTSIGNFAFGSCEYLTSVEIPDSVTSIGDNAFFSCWNLTDVIISNNITCIGACTFSGCSKLSSITIPSGVTSIGNSAFSMCDISNITIPSSVTSIGDYAFSYSSLSSVTIPDSVISIGNGAFDHCGKLTSIILPCNITNIGEKIFYECRNLTSITIPDSVTSIGNSAFYGCKNLISITMPNSVKNIEGYAFNACDGLTIIFYTGSQDEWENIYIPSGNDPLNNATKVYNAAKKTYKFETNCSSKLADMTDYAVMTVPKPVNGDKTLVGWYDNKNLSGTPVSFPYYGTATTLYAAWTDKTGLSFDDAFTAKANMQYNVTTAESGQLIYYEFVPRLTGEYRFYSTGNLDTYGYLYDSNQKQLTSNDDGGNGNNFKITYTLTAGETYYITAKVYNSAGSFTLVTETDCVESTNTVCVTATTGEKIFITIPSYLPENASVILACYKNNALTEVMTAPNKNETLYFITKKDFDSAKVMVWGSLESMMPICEAEVVK